MPSLTVGNGLCAVPLRGKYNPCRQPEPPPDMSFRANAVSRGIHPSSKFYLVVVLFCYVVDSSTPLALRSE